MALSEQEIADIRTSLKRCSQETIDATLRFRESNNPEEIPTVIYGIIERYLPPESNVSLKNADDTTSLMEDLGIDSLTMLEIVLSIEEALGISIPTEELREIRTLGDAKNYIQQRLLNPTDEGESQSKSLRQYSVVDIATILPQQPPFLFLDSAEIEGETVRAKYEIKGTEDFLEGHFKGNPVFPASIVFEALGQAACLWILECAPERTGQPLAGNEILFASLDGANFYKKAKPGDVLEFEVQLKRLRAPVGIFAGKVTCKGDRVAKIDEVMLAFGAEISEALDAKSAEKVEEPSVS